VLGYKCDGYQENKTKNKKTTPCSVALNVARVRCSDGRTDVYSCHRQTRILDWNLLQFEYVLLPVAKQSSDVSILQATLKERKKENMGAIIHEDKGEQNGAVCSIREQTEFGNEKKNRTSIQWEKIDAKRLGGQAKQALVCN
jgi:uncharacterized protein YdiU (UPF0061 family)